MVEKNMNLAYTDNGSFDIGYNPDRLNFHCHNTQYNLLANQPRQAYVICVLLKLAKRSDDAHKRTFKVSNEKRNK